MANETWKETAERIGKTLGHLSYETGRLREELHKRGGLEGVAAEGGERVGEVVGKAAKFVDGARRYAERFPTAEQVYAAGRTRVDDYTERGRDLGFEVGQKVREGTEAAHRTVGELSDRVKGAADNVSRTMMDVLDTIAGSANDYAAPPERTVLIGLRKTPYTVGSDSKKTVAATRAYLETTHSAMGDEAGKTELLGFIAQYAVADMGQLKARWEEKGMPESNAYRRATMP